MSEIDTSDRASRFDRADYVARQPVVVQRQATPATLAGLLISGAQQEDSGTELASESAPPRTTNAARLPTGDEQIAADHLKGSGWSQVEIESILGGPPHPDAPQVGQATSLAQAEAHLRSLGWTQSDIARLLVGPEKSHLTAEALFRQHAANPEADQQALVKAMDQSGAQKVKPDRALIAGLDAAHLNPDSPADLEQIISQFAELPDVQKQRFLLLLDSQKRDKNKTAGTDGSSPKKGSGKTDGETSKPSGPMGEALPIVKSGLDLLNSALKGLLGSTKGGTAKKGKGSVQRDPVKDSADDQDGAEEPSDWDETDGSTEQTDDSAEDTSSPSDEGDSSSMPDDQIDLDSESAPD